MKKILIFCLLLFIGSFCFADLVQNKSEGFTWAEYEVQSRTLGIEPCWEHYIYLCENPQCYFGSEESFIELERLFMEIK